MKKNIKFDKIILLSSYMNIVFIYTMRLIELKQIYMNDDKTNNSLKFFRLNQDNIKLTLINNTNKIEDIKDIVIFDNKKWNYDYYLSLMDYLEDITYVVNNKYCINNLIDLKCLNFDKTINIINDDFEINDNLNNTTISILERFVADNIINYYEFINILKEGKLYLEKYCTETIMIVNPILIYMNDIVDNKYNDIKNNLKIFNDIVQLDDVKKIYISESNISSQNNKSYTIKLRNLAVIDGELNSDNVIIAKPYCGNKNKFKKKNGINWIPASSSSFIVNYNGYEYAIYINNTQNLTSNNKFEKIKYKLLKVNEENSSIFLIYIIGESKLFKLEVS